MKKIPCILFFSATLCALLSAGCKSGSGAGSGAQSAGGLETEFWYFNAPRPYCPAPEKVAAQIQQDLAQVGIRAKLVTFDWTTYLEKTQKGEHTAMLIGWSGDNGDPDNFLNTLLSTASAKLPAQNYAFFRDAEVDGFLNKAKFDSDMAHRTEFYKQAQQLIYERVPVIPIAHNLQVAVASDRIQNLILSPDTRKHWEEVTLLPAGGKPGRDETLIWARGADASGLDPASETDGESLNVAVNIFDGLVRFKTGTTEIEPSLATSWEISPDGLTYTFHLRPHVKFTDGRPVNADAVVFSLERQRDENHPAHKLASQFVYWGSMDMNNILESVRKTDDATVVMKLKHPEAPFLADLAMQFAMIVSPDAVMKQGKNFSRHPVGSGAYTLVEWQAGQKLVLQANPDWWGGKPKVKRVIWTVIKDNSSRTQAYLAGNVDGFEGVNPFELEKIKAAPKTQILTQAGMNVFYLAMNMDKKPFDNLKVRQAFAYAINRERIVKNFYGGMATPAATMLPPSLWGHDSSLQPYPYDPEKAKALLKEAGIATPLDVTLTLPPPHASRPDRGRPCCRSPSSSRYWRTAYSPAAQHG